MIFRVPFLSDLTRILFVYRSFATKIRGCGCGRVRGCDVLKRGCVSEFVQHLSLKMLQ